MVAAVLCEQLVRIHRSGTTEVQALQGLDLRVEPGEVVAVVGASGSGKSTLLNVLAGTDAPSAGRATVAGHELAGMTAGQRVRYRREVVGVVFQQAARNLLPHLTAEQNVGLPMALAGTGRRERAARTRELLGVLGVAGVAERRPAQSSGGEQQRVALAVALANRPAVLLADEPTGELDTTSSREVLAALSTASTELGTTVLVVTHDPGVSEQVARTVAIRDGRTSSEVLRRTEVDDDGAARLVSEEFAVLDRAGRVQLPREHREALELAHRVRLALEADHIAVRPADRPGR
ncbi:ABC transporter ATP-binding protein [Quadrisphaera sp. INWT6]|uniref:ABC transporter ATP-binding protein n=1 Tax=Quadrisphaera sp. INWT6 TaxID=2596917 RepID=UPI0018927A76|nr:ABC transporter ATP-binding protein [Quadrisphaera sp. INWT6]MBF5083598.1 ABC transporter ATP-binding protein [Quadrisphaera sp. INWT6]